MNSERWDQIEEIYQKALDCTPEDRRTFIIEACAEDEELLHEIESLLKESVAVDGFMECQAVELAVESLARDGSRSLVGRRLNHYQIVSKLGAGGMAEVYRARSFQLRLDWLGLAVHVSQRAIFDPDRQNDQSCIGFCGTL